MKKIYSNKISNIFKEAQIESNKLNHNYVGTEHLLLAILKHKSHLCNYLKKHNLDYKTFYKNISNSYNLNNKNKNKHYTPLLKKIISSNEINDKKLLFGILRESEGSAVSHLINMGVDVDNIYNYLSNDEKYSNLEIYKYGNVLNKTVSYNEKVLGRDKEIELISQVLLRKKKCNPLLVGDAGIGKSAIVEQLVRNMMAKRLDSRLNDKIVISLSISSLVAGTKYRGQFEEKINAIINEASSNKNIILFIDEIHNLVNAGGAEGAISAGEILKPYLARGNIKCIGATTKEEYEKYIANDKALSRRFEIINIKEPNENETISILKGVKKEYTSFHKVNVSDEMLEIIAHLSNIYFPNKRFPDKAIDLLDSVMSYVKSHRKSKDDIKKELNNITNDKILAFENDDFKRAMIKSKKENYLKKRIESNYMSIKKEDILKTLELKNNIISKSKKIKVIKNNFNTIYKKEFINKICESINDNKVSIMSFTGDCKNFIDKFASVLNYDINILTNNNLDKIINKIKYNPSQIIIVKSKELVTFNDIIEKAKENNLVEYNNEYVCFNGVIIIYLIKNNKIGFNQHLHMNNVIDFNNSLVLS